MSLSVLSNSSFSPSVDTEARQDAIAPKRKQKQSKQVMSWGEFKAWDGGNIRNVAQPLTSAAVLDALDPAVVAQRPDPKSFFARYNGKISNKTKSAQYVRINDVTANLLFSQRDVSDFNKGKTCDYPLGDLADALFVEFKKIVDTKSVALDVVDMGGGVFTSVDNRRLLIAKKIGLIDRTYGIWVRVHSSKDALSASLQQRFGGATTWGAAVKGRINSQDTSCKGYTALPTIKTTTAGGSREDAPDQTILLSVDCDLSALHADDVANIKRLQKNNMIRI